MLGVLFPFCRRHRLRTFAAVAPFGRGQRKYRVGPNERRRPLSTPGLAQWSGNNPRLARKLEQSAPRCHRPWMIKPRFRLTLTALALLGGASAVAQSRYATLPTADDMARAYPPKAAAEFVGGHATISCAVTPEAALANCSVKSEAPADDGFGAAALALAGKITLTPANLPATIDDSPGGFSFGDAALKLVERELLTAAPRSVDGVPLGDEIVRVVAPFRFRRK